MAQRLKDELNVLLYACTTLKTFHSQTSLERLRYSVVKLLSTIKRVLLRCSADH